MNGFVDLKRMGFSDGVLEPRPSRFGSGWSSRILAGTLLAFVVGCGDHDRLVKGTDSDAGEEPEPQEPDSGGIDADPDAGAPEEDSGAEPPVTIGGLVITTEPGGQELDLFGAVGHRFWIEVSPEELERMNGSGDGFPGPFISGDIYTPGSAATYADHVVVQDAKTGSVADYGKLELKLVGESTFRNWSENTIPNLRIDSDEFQPKRRLGGFEHIRLNNALVGSIFREHLAHRVYQALGYPALRSTFAFAGSNVWGEDIWVPMTLIEVYKTRFCKDNAELIGGGETCKNMWEFAGDVGQGGGFPWPEPGPGPRPLPLGMEKQAGDEPLPMSDERCQIKECDNRKLDELATLLNQTPRGPGFKEALDPLISWDHFHRFQCLSWIMWTGDDMLHNSNNNLIVEREDGRLVWAPYSVDISAGQDWYQNTPLTGSSAIPAGCQLDSECWRDTIAACETLIDAFDALNPETLVDETKSRLEEHGMLRSGDHERARLLRKWFVDRQANLREELEIYRHLPDHEGNCPNDLERCADDTCATPEVCEERRCFAGQTWCDSKERCIEPMFEECPQCPAETPLFCEEIYACVAGYDECGVIIDPF